MEKIMFDSNIFDRIGNYKRDLEKSLKEFEYYVTSTQVKELCDIPDASGESRKKAILNLVDLRPKLVPTSVFVMGHVWLNSHSFGKGTVYEEVLNENKSNIKDAIIADTAATEGCILVTNDKRLISKMQQRGYKVLDFESFLVRIKEEDS